MRAVKHIRAKWMVALFAFALLSACGGGGGGGATSPTPNPTSNSSPDATAPSVPAGLIVTVASAQSTTANLQWTPSTDPDGFGVYGYNIYRNGAFLESVWGTSATDAGLTLGVDYCYTVSAYDFAGNESAQCAPFCLDRVPPTVPTILSATPASPSQMDLLWTAATDTGSGLAGYNLYRDGIQVKSSLTGTAASNGGLAQGTSYCFTVTAFDNALNESAQSPPVCATTPPWQFEYITQSTTTTNPSSMNDGDSSSIAIDTAGNLHAVYEDDNAWPYLALDYATNASGFWVTTQIASIISGAASSITTDSNNKVHICYTVPTYTQDFLYMTNAPGSWMTSTIETGTAGSNIGTGNSIAVDKNNKVHVSYSDANGAKLKYATNASGSWVVTVIDTDTYWQGISSSSIALDSQGNVHISYVGGTTNNSTALKYATNASGSWVVTVVDDTDDFDSTSIALDSKDKAHIAYHCYFYGTLNYATNASGQWTTSIIDSSSYADDVGDYPSLAIDKNDKVHIGYQEQDNYNAPLYRTLKHATNASGEWTAAYVVVPAASLNLGYSNSLVIDLNNKVHISTYDAGNLGLKHEYY